MFYKKFAASSRGIHSRAVRVRLATFRARHTVKSCKVTDTHLFAANFDLIDMNALTIEELKKVQRDNVQIVCFLVTMKRKCVRVCVCVAQ